MGWSADSSRREGSMSSRQFQQSLPAGKTYQLMRVRLNSNDALIPEISGHRLMASVRLMQRDAEGRLKPSSADTTFELTLCA